MILTPSQGGTPTRTSQYDHQQRRWMHRWLENDAVRQRCEFSMLGTVFELCNTRYLNHDLRLQTGHVVLHDTASDRKTPESTETNARSKTWRTEDNNVLHIPTTYTNSRSPA